MTVPAGCQAAHDSDVWVVAARGPWTLHALGELQAALSALDGRAAKAARIELRELSALDTGGAWLLHRLRRSLEDKGIAVAFAGASPENAALIERIAAADKAQPLPAPRISPLREMVERVGVATFAFGREARNLLAFFGLTVATLWRVALHPSRLRIVSLVSHIEQAGLNALPILGLLSFLIGVVLAYQGADQLRQFGAEIFTVNLLGVSVLREIGILLTAILVAGRSGSAFTAQIGTMKVNEEVDALRTLGLDPMEVLVLPRLVALIVVVPLLGFYANVMALLGGAMMSILALDLTLSQFLHQLESAIDLKTLWVGLIKAPVFALLIGMVGCYEGLQVEGSADSVGRQTTKSVVESIFLVIVADAVFSIFFSMIGV